MDEKSLEALIHRGETPTVEFKIAPPRPSDLAERICGFANSLGGYIIFGVKDKTWQLEGVKDISDALDKVLQAARLCKPPVRFDPIHPHIVELEEKQLIIAHISPNDGTLYQSGGVCWIRRGTFTVPMTVTEIEEFLYSKGVLAWETQPVLRATLEDVDMKQVEAYLEQRSERSKVAGRLSKLEDILLNIGCAAVTKDEQQQEIIRPTNAGLLLFGYDPQQILLQAEVVCVLYTRGSARQRFADRRILHGTITQQIDQAEAFLKQYIPVAGRIEGFHRIDEPDYPIEALREAVVNAVVHRDYSLRGEAVRVFYYPDRVEIHNPGLLMPGVSLEDLRMGRVRSKPRNPVIATSLRDFPGGYMERVGSGISFMIDQMRQLGRPDPRFEERGEFIVTFFKELPAASVAETESSLSTSVDQRVNEQRKSSINSADAERKKRQRQALRYVHMHGFITSNQYHTLTDIPELIAAQELEAMRKQGALRAIDQSSGRRYML